MSGGTLVCLGESDKEFKLENKCHISLGNDGTIEEQRLILRNAILLISLLLCSVAEEDFLGYLDEWEGSIDPRTEFTRTEQKRMCFS